MTTVEIKPDRAKDPDGRRMAELIRASSQAERFGALRSLTIHALAVLGVVLWVGVAFPRHFPEGLRRYALAGFATVALGALVALALEARWQGVQRRCMRENDAKVLDDGDA